MLRVSRFALVFALAATSAFAENAAQTQTDPGIRTVAFANSDPTGYPPKDGSWSPDGTRLTFLATDSRIAHPGDIIQVEAATGKASVLATAAQLSALSSDKIDEKDRDHRERYEMANFLWAQDSKHLLLDKGGRLWLYNIADGTGTLIVDTGAGSGDDPKFSPDAKYVSYLRDHNLYLHPVYPHPVAGGSAKETALTSTTPETLLNGEVDWVYLEELDVRSNYFWSPDSSAIAYLQMDEAKVPEYPITDFIPTHATIDQQRYPQPGDPNPAVRVGIVAAKGGKTKFIELPFNAGNDYIPRFGWVDASTLYIEVLTRDQQHLSLYFADARTGASRLVVTATDAKYIDENYDVTFLDGGKFVVPSWRDGHTHLYLYTFDAKHPLAAEATLARQLTQGDYEVENIAGFDAKSNTLFYVSNEGSPLDNGLWSIRLDGTGKQKLTTTDGVHDVLLSPDAVHFSDVASTATTPYTASLCTIHQGCTAFWKPTQIAPATGVSAQTVTFTAADGKTKLYGRLTLPAGGAAKGAAGSTPLILNPYGGPIPTAGMRNQWGDGNLFNELLAQHGFAVLEVDNRGMGGRGRDFQQAAYRDFGPVQFSDQMAALDQALVRYPQLDGKRIGWWGWSWGGSFTLYAMTHTDRIRAGVAVAPVTDFRNYDSIYTERYLGLPSANADVYTADSDVASAGHLKGRVLIAQGTGDDNVHMANTIQFVQPLIDAGIPYDLQFFPRKTHSIAGRAARNELFNRILWQFETYLK
jgi:dipeptidyl-peptidase-4